jgi:hypothetical protein
MSTQHCRFLILILCGLASAATAQKTVNYSGETFHYRIVIDSTLSVDSVNLEGLPGVVEDHKKNYRDTQRR